MSLVAPGDTELGLTQEFLREKPELGGLGSGRRARDSCVLQSPADLLGCKIKVRLFPLPFDCDLCEDKKSLWSLLRSLLGQNVSTALPGTDTASGTSNLSWQPCSLSSQGVGDVLHKGFSCSQGSVEDWPGLGSLEQQVSNAISLKEL